MTEKCFVDTNVLVYLFDPASPAKSAIAGEWMGRLWRERTGRLSIQVLNELYTVLTRKLKRTLAADDIWEEVHAYLAWEPRPLDRELFLKAREVSLRYLRGAANVSRLITAPRRMILSMLVQARIVSSGLAVSSSRFATLPASTLP